MKKDKLVPEESQEKFEEVLAEYFTKGSDYDIDQQEGNEKSTKTFTVILVQKAITYLETRLDFEATSKKEAIKMAKAQRELYEDVCWDDNNWYELTGEETYNVI